MADEPVPVSRIAGCLLAGLALVAGVWYSAFGISLLANLPQAIHRWIVSSGDQGFWLNIEALHGAGVALAVLAIILGFLSIREAGRTFASRYEPPRRWHRLMTIAILVGLLRGFAERIAGILTPWRVGSFLAVCALYGVLWIVDGPPVRHVRSAGL